MALKVSVLEITSDQTHRLMSFVVILLQSEYYMYLVTCEIVHWLSFQTEFDSLYHLSVAGQWHWLN